MLEQATSSENRLLVGQATPQTPVGTEVTRSATQVRRSIYHTYTLHLIFWWRELEPIGVRVVSAQL